MSNGMKVFIAVVLVIFFLRHPEILSQILNQIFKALNG